MPTPLGALDEPTPPLAEAVPIRSKNASASNNNSGDNSSGGGNGRGRRGERDLPGVPPMSPTSPMSPGATLRAMRRQTSELRERTRAHKEAQAQTHASRIKEEVRHYPLPLSPIQILAARRPQNARRESSLTRLGRRLSMSSTRRPSMKSIRKSLRKSRSDVSGGQQVVKKRQSASNLARRESARLKGILKPSLPLQVRSQNQETASKPVHSTNTTPIAPTTVPPPADEKPSTGSSGPTTQPGSGYALVAQKKVGASWHPPRREPQRRQSTKLRNMLRPNSRPGSGIHRKPALSKGKECPMKPSVTPDKTEGTKLKRSSPRSSPRSSLEKEDQTKQSQEPAFEIVAGPATATSSQLHGRLQDHAETQAPKTFRDGKELLSEIETKHLSAAEARKLIRQHNREYFHSRIWDPALQEDFVGACQLANEHEEPPEAGPSRVINIQSQSEPKPQNQPQSESQPQPRIQPQVPAKSRQRDSLQALLAPPVPEKDRKVSAEKDDWRRYDSPASAEDWGRSVRLAMARLENKITNEATTDPVRFMKARRESAQLRAWIAAQRRTSEARLSAIAMGRVQPESPFEQAFVAELLKENEIKFKHSSNPMLEAQKLFKDLDSRKSSLLPHYVPFSQHPLLAPLEEIEAEGKQEEQEGSTESAHSEEEERPVHVFRRTFSIFDEKKAARRAGRNYKSLSTSTQLDALEMHEARCCGLWRRKPFVDKIS